MLSAIVGGLAALAPWIGRAISGDDGERTAQQIADVACAVTGVQNPKEAVQRVQDDPEAQRRFVLEVQKLELEFYRAETARLDSVNQTMRAELGVGADVANGWQFALALLKSGWRPFWGYVSAVVWGIFIVGILWLLADVVKTSGLAGVAPVVTALSQVISALMPIFMMALTVLGVAVWKRSSDKKTLGGPEQKASPAGMLEKLPLPKFTRGAK